MGGRIRIYREISRSLPLWQWRGRRQPPRGHSPRVSPRTKKHVDRGHDLTHRSGHAVERSCLSVKFGGECRQNCFSLLFSSRIRSSFDANSMM